jgi:hypothetical protein
MPMDTIQVIGIGCKLAQYNNTSIHSMQKIGFLIGFNVFGYKQYFESTKRTSTFNE